MIHLPKSFVFPFILHLAQSRGSIHAEWIELKSNGETVYSDIAGC